MDAIAQLDSLLELAQSVGITVRRCPPAAEADSHPGGALIRLKGKEILFLDPSACAADQISVVAASLKGREGLEQRYLSPEIRAILEQ